ncbi:related to integral membrane protein [Rhynchosporium secalis]|uniref:Related to integral membrane protein n=1 Tax=Rhynchosporium secalis TaxID=38038 RepID=A0A1E1MPV9_RHYSE|nr:related to integral membrane protein [Rhynchosporium secalis]
MDGSDNYSGVTRGAQVTGVAVCSLGLAWISFTLRFYVRIAVLKFLGRDDWLTIAAMIVFTIFCSLCLRVTYYGLGAHMYNIEDESLQTGFKIVFICELLYVVTTTVTKVAVAAYFLRLASKRYQRVVVYYTLSTVMVFSTLYFFFLIFQCSPMNYLWTKYGDDGAGRCLKSTTLSAITYAHCAMSAITDWSFGILPIFFVRKMQMDPRTKFSVILILSLGFFASSATIVRIVYIKALTDTEDYSWEGINLVKWSMVEPAIAITAMNIATLRPLFTRFLSHASKQFDSSTQSEYQTRSSGESRHNFTGRDSISAALYSTEFAELLGLSRVGVTTQITAGGNEKRDHMRKRWRLHRSIHSLSGQKQKDEKWRTYNESQTELSTVPSTADTSDIEHVGAVDWAAGITTTTVITYQRS